MGNFPKTVISASRRTDIPAFYMDWFMGGIRKGVFDVVNPYNRRVTKVPVAAGQVHTIVFWSKNYAPFLSGDFGTRLEQAGYHLAFHFTVNSQSLLLEPNVPPLPERLTQIKALCRRHGPGAVIWRFDPICRYRVGNGEVMDNLADFERIAAVASGAGIRRCITSFMDPYRKIERRVSRMDRFSFIDSSTEWKRSTLLDMHRTLAALNIGLEVCCERPVLDGLPADSGIKGASCISHQDLMDGYGGDLPGKRDRGQRMGKGCGCDISSDIGSYHRHPCYHNCLFCYANPAAAPGSGNWKSKP